MAKGRRVTARNRPKIMAPVTRKNTIAEIFSDSATELTNPFQVRRRLTRVTTRAKKTPTAPASVGVKRPVYRPPMTSTKIMTASMTPNRERIFSLKLVLGPAGPNFG